MSVCGSVFITDDQIPQIGIMIAIRFHLIAESCLQTPSCHPARNVDTFVLINNVFVGPIQDNGYGITWWAGSTNETMVSRDCSPPPRQGACMLGIGQFVKAPIGQPTALFSPNSRMVAIQYKPHWLRMLSIERQCNAYRVNTQGHFNGMEKLSQGHGQWLGF